MDGEARRAYIMEALGKAEKAVTGTALARHCDVSRQIIVGDVAVLRNHFYTARVSAHCREARHDSPCLRLLPRLG